MSRRSLLAAAAACLASLLAAGCQGREPIPATDLQIRVEAGVRQIGLGEAFPLTVTRIWKKQLVPAEFNERALEPLTVRLIAIERREDPERVEEVRRYQAHAFTLEDVVLEGPILQAYPRGGGAALEVRAEEFRLAVLPALDPEQPGDPELPRPPFPEPVPGWAWVAALALLLAIALWIRRWIRRRQALPPAEPPGPAPHERALARLELLAARPFEDGDEAASQAFHVEAASVVRDYLEQRFEACRPEMTTEEFLDSPRTAGVLCEAHRALLARLLLRCDLVKFGRVPSTREERGGLLALAASFVQETRPGEEAA